MKKSRLIFSILIMTLMLVAVCLPANAASGDVIKLKGNINAQTIRKVDEVVPGIYQNQVLGIVTAHRDNLLTSSFTSDELKDATFSKPIPVFSSMTDYKKNDDFKTKLTLTSWFVVAYVKDTPVTIFQIGTQSDQFDYYNTYNQDLAISFDNVIKQLGTDDVICLPVEGQFFLADGSDWVGYVTGGDDCAQQSLVSFDTFNAACNQTINYNAANPDMIGGGPLLTYLYSSNPTTNTTNVLLIALISSGVLVLAGVTFFAVKKIRAK